MKLIKQMKNLKVKIAEKFKGKFVRKSKGKLKGKMEEKFGDKKEPVCNFLNRFSLIFHYLLACLINLIIEVLSRHSFTQAWKFMISSPKVFMFNAFLIFATFSIVYLVRRRVFARILISIFWLFLGGCNGYLLMKRVTPFNAQDLKVLRDALPLVRNYLNNFEIVLLAIGIVALIFWMMSMWRKVGLYKGKLNRVVAIVGVALSFFVYSQLTRVAIEDRVISTYFGNIAFAYEDYGFPYCFTSSIFNTGIAEPEGYSKEAIDEITDDGNINRFETSRVTEELPNIIFVQLETYFDPTEIKWIECSEDPIPNQRKMYEEFSSGYFKVPSVGAGTANTEFEVLTGMNMRYFGPGEYPYKTYAKTKLIESAASALQELGYGACALHNNGGNFYSRAEVFNHMGFDHYTSKEFMHIRKLTPKGWATDDILIPNILESMDQTEGQDFIFAISVQGHGDYPEEPMFENPEIIVSGVEDEGRRNAWEYYINEVHEMDKFAGDLVKAIEQRGEPTVIVFYGDHLPTMNLVPEDLHNKYLYNTNYVIWDNIGLEKEDRNVAAYQIMADVFERLDIHAGTVFNYHQERRESKDYLSDLEMLQYDMLYGEQYVYDKNGSPLKPGHLAMGLKDTVISGINRNSDGTYSITGEYFTKQSKVYINGDKQKSSFINNTKIILKEADLEDGDVLQINQMGSSNTVFRTSKQYQYNNGELIELPVDPNAPEPGRNAFVDDMAGQKID